VIVFRNIVSSTKNFACAIFMLLLTVSDYCFQLLIASLLLQFNGLPE